MRKYRRRTAAVLVLVGTITLLSPLLARASTSTGDASAVRTAHAAFLEREHGEEARGARPLQVDG
jgi:hypothetical protein